MELDPGNMYMHFKLLNANPSVWVCFREWLKACSRERHATISRGLAAFLVLAALLINDCGDAPRRVPQIL